MSDKDPQVKAERRVRDVACLISEIAEGMKNEATKKFYVAEFHCLLSAHHDLTGIVEECWRVSPAREAAE